MNVRSLNADPGQRSGPSGQSDAYVLLEMARLRCESLLTRVTRPDEQLRAIHREIGMAGYETCADFDSGLRHDCMAVASTRLGSDPGRSSEQTSGARVHALGPALAAMFSETIAASDALAGELADRDVEEADRDRLHLVHSHVMAACELLDERLTLLELEGAGTGS